MKKQNKMSALKKIAIRTWLAGLVGMIELVTGWWILVLLFPKELDKITIIYRGLSSDAGPYIMLIMAHLFGLGTIYIFGKIKRNISKGNAKMCDEIITNKPAK